jgi:predicted ArsR family transcriptional regulator
MVKEVCIDRRFDTEITSRILAHLRENKFGSISEIAEGANTTRITAKKHLERLARRGFLQERQIGLARVFFVSNLENLAVNRRRCL